MAVILDVLSGMLYFHYGIIELLLAQKQTLTKANNFCFDHTIFCNPDNQSIIMFIQHFTPSKGLNYLVTITIGVIVIVSIFLTKNIVKMLFMICS